MHHARNGDPGNNPPVAHVRHFRHAGEEDDFQNGSGRKRTHKTSVLSSPDLPEEQTADDTSSRSRAVRNQELESNRNGSISLSEQDSCAVEF
jgi:hypothetical protein